MFIEIDFKSNDALYMQVHDQIILGIAKSLLREGDQLPSVRKLAEEIGINMHTVNKAYSVLRQDGFVKVDRRKGAVIAVDIDRLRAMAETENDLKVVLARALCRGMTREELHGMVDHIFDEFTKNG